MIRCTSLIVDYDDLMSFVDATLDQIDYIDNNDWNNNLSDVLALYGQVSLFSQYFPDPSNWTDRNWSVWTNP